MKRITILTWCVPYVIAQPAPVWGGGVMRAKKKTRNY